MTNKNTLGRFPKQYLPYYDTNSDFNTNSFSYYDYLAKINYTLGLIIEELDKKTIQNLKVKDTDSVKMGIVVNESDNEVITTIDSLVKLSKSVQNLHIMNKVYRLENGIELYPDGLYVKDYTELIGDIVSKINEILKMISDLEKRINDIENRLKDIEKRLKDIEENGGGSQEPEEVYLGNYKEYEFDYIKGNTKTVRVDLGAASTSDTLGDIDTETAEDVGHIVYNIPSSFIPRDFKIKFSEGFLKLGNLQAKNFKIHLINNDKTHLTLKMGDGFINGKVQGIMKEDGTFFDSENFCTLLAGTTTTIHGTVYTNPEGEILRTYAKYTVTQGVGV